MAIKPSLRLAMLLLLFHVMVASVVYVTLLLLAVKLAMLILILLSMFFYLARDVLLLFPGSWREICFDKSSVLVVTHGGSDFSGQITSRSVVSPYFVILHVKLHAHHLPIFRVIFPDALGTGAFRELCVHLKFSQ